MPDESAAGGQKRMMLAIGGLGLALLATGSLAPMLQGASAHARDRDHDGLSDRFERSHSHTRVRRADTDRDGLRDGPEVNRFHTNPRRRDTDRDGLSDGAEVKRYRTNPRKRDTDRDGLSDGAEVKRYKTNPRKRDTDGDGITDGREVKQLQTNPLKQDSDGNGVPDGGPPAPSPPIKAPQRTCSTVVTSVEAAESAVSGAAPGTVVCLSDGSYGVINLSASKSAEVVLQAEHPAGATLAGASMGGSHLTLSQFKVEGSAGITLEPGSVGMVVDHNRITGGGQGIDTPSVSTPISDFAIVGNQFVGPFGEDAIHLNRYHDGSDADSYGALIEGNEFTNIREDGEHNDCLQTVFVGDHLYFRQNYLHDNACQGFFIKDQASSVDTVVVDNNLIVRNAAGCIPASLCPNFTLSALQLFGPITHLQITRNTIWTPEEEAPTTLRESGYTDVSITSNVIYRAWSDSSAAFSDYSASNNTACSREGTWPATGFATTDVCTPAFPNRAAGDYRISGRGVTWAVADQHFGP